VEIKPIQRSGTNVETNIRSCCDFHLDAILFSRPRDDKLEEFSLRRSYILIDLLGNLPQSFID